MNNCKKIILVLLSVLFFPISISYMLSRNKNIISEDIRVVNEKLGVPWRGVLGLMYQMLKNRYFRNIFYKRIEISFFFTKWFFPEDKTFVISGDIGPGIYPAHPFATIIHAESIGKNFSFRQCTTIGNKIDGRNDLIPIIGDNVTLGANVCVIGRVKIGNNVIVGAGTVVVKDIPDNTIVVGNPSRIIKNNYL